MTTLTEALTATLARRDADELAVLRAECNAIAVRLDAAGSASVADLIAERDALKTRLLDSTELGDALNACDALRADLATAAEVTARLTEERDTIKASVAAVEDANYALRAQRDAAVEFLTTLDAWDKRVAASTGRQVLADHMRAKLDAALLLARGTP